MTLPDLLCHAAKLFATYERPTDPQYPLKIADHSLKQLDAASGLRLGEPNQTAAGPIHGGEIALNLRTQLKNRLWDRYLEALCAGSAHPLLGQLEKGAAYFLLEILISRSFFQRSQSLQSGRIGDPAQEKDNG